MRTSKAVYDRNKGCLARSGYAFGSYSATTR